MASLKSVCATLSLHRSTPVKSSESEELPDSAEVADAAWHLDLMLRGRSLNMSRNRIHILAVTHLAVGLPGRIPAAQPKAAVEHTLY